MLRACSLSLSLSLMLGSLWYVSGIAPVYVRTGTAGTGEIQPPRIPLFLVRDPGGPAPFDTYLRITATFLYIPIMV